MDVVRREVDSKVNDFLKLIVPVLMTGLGVLTIDLFTKVNDLQLKFSANARYLVMLQNLDKQATDHEVRLRSIESVCANRIRRSGTAKAQYVSKTRD